MTRSSVGTDVLECGSCGNLGVGDGPITCCERPMRPAAGSVDAVPDPTLSELLRAVFEMNESELDICLCVMESGELTVRELAERTAYDRSSVARHLGHLLDLGVVERRRQLLQRGGHVYVYRPNDPETVRRRFREAFVGWVAAANARIDDLSREKVETIVDTDAERPQWRIYREEP